MMPLVAGSAEASLDIFKANTWIIAKDFVAAPALSKEIDDEFNGKARTSDNRLTNQDIWVNSDASLPIHKQTWNTYLFITDIFIQSMPMDTLTLTN